MVERCSSSHRSKSQILVENRNFSPQLGGSRRNIAILLGIIIMFIKQKGMEQMRQQDAYLAIRPAYPRGCCPRAAKGDKTYLQPVFLHR